MAVREDEMAAESMGLDTRNLKLLSCFIAAIPAGMAGVMFAATQTYVSPVSFTFTESIMIVAMVIGSFAAYLINPEFGEAVTRIKTVGAPSASFLPLSMPDFSHRQYAR